MKWFSALCYFRDHDNETGCPDMVNIEAIFQVADVLTVWARVIDIDETSDAPAFSFHGIEIIFKSGKKIMTETYDLRGFCMNVLGNENILEAIE